MTPSSALHCHGNFTRGFYGKELTNTVLSEWWAGMRRQKRTRWALRGCQRKNGTQPRPHQWSRPKREQRYKKAKTKQHRYPSRHMPPDTHIQSHWRPLTRRYASGSLSSLAQDFCSHRVCQKPRQRRRLADPEGRNKQLTKNVSKSTWASRQADRNYIIT